MQYLLLPADGAVSSNRLHSSTIHSAVSLNLHYFLQGKRHSDPGHRDIRPEDIVLFNGQMELDGNFRCRNYIYLLLFNLLYIESTVQMFGVSMIYIYIFILF